MEIAYRIGKLSLSIVCIGLTAACAAPTFNMPVENPVATDLKYEEPSSQSHSILVTDSRPPEAKFSEGRLNFNVQVQGSDINEVEFLSSAIEEELNSRGTPAELTKTAQPNQNLDIQTFKILNHRVSAFSPLVTFTMFAGNFTASGNTKRVVSFIKRGKVPIWAITEKGIVENTFNQPLSLLAKDIATRMTQHMGNEKISNSAVDSLFEKIENENLDDPARYMKVYQLGFGNNPSAIDHLVDLLDEPDEYVRLAAISSLGLLDAESEVERLIKIFKGSDLWQDRGMALKALADIDTPESREIIRAERKRIASMGEIDNEAEWNKEILTLYR